MNVKSAHVHLLLPVMRCKKMAVIDMSFHQCAVIKFLVKEGKLTGVIYERLRGVYGDFCMGTSSVRRWVKHFKDGNTDIADQPRCGLPRTAATERNKRKVEELIRQDRGLTVTEIAAQLGMGHHAVQEMMDILGCRKVGSRWVPRLLRSTQDRETAGIFSTIHPTVRMWPPQTTICSGPWKITWEVTTTTLTRQSRKPCEAGCEELERTSTAEACLRFCNASRNA
jgi:transposase